MKTIINTTFGQKQQGFTLVEVLVAIVVLSVGLLGLAGLQVTSLKNNNSAAQRSIASLLANDILDRIRSNRDGLSAGEYDTLEPGSYPSAPTSPDCVTSSCDTAQIAAYDMSGWGVQLGNLLPSGTGKIVGTGANSIFTITIMWDEDRTGVTGTDCSGDSSVDLTCFTMSSRL